MKIDDYSVSMMCNTLNAIAGMYLPSQWIQTTPETRQQILYAKEMISTLYEENKKLKGEK